MPDVHLGVGAVIGSVIPTSKAIIPAAVGVDLGCGMMAVRTSLRADDLRTDLPRRALQSGSGPARPHEHALGWTECRGREVPGRGLPDLAADDFERICEKHPSIAEGPTALVHLGTPGTGNHFIELCLDEADQVWVMLHSGSRGVGNRIGSSSSREGRHAPLVREHS